MTFSLSLILLMTSLTPLSTLVSGLLSFLLYIHLQIHLPPCSLSILLTPSDSSPPTPILHTSYTLDSSSPTHSLHTTYLEKPHLDKIWFSTFCQHPDKHNWKSIASCLIFSSWSLTSSGPVFSPAIPLHLPALFLLLLSCYCGWTISTPSKATSSITDQILSPLMWLFPFLPKLQFSSILGHFQQYTDILLCSLFLNAASLPNYCPQFSAALYNKIHQKNCLHSLCPLPSFALKGKQVSSSPLFQSSSCHGRDCLCHCHFQWSFLGPNSSFWSTDRMCGWTQVIVCKTSLLCFPILSRSN